MFTTALLILSFYNTQHFFGDPVLKVAFPAIILLKMRFNIHILSYFVLNKAAHICFCAGCCSALIDKHESLKGRHQEGRCIDDPCHSH